MTGPVGPERRPPQPDGAPRAATTPRLPNSPANLDARVANGRVGATAADQPGRTPLEAALPDPRGDQSAQRRDLSENRVWDRTHWDPFGPPPEGHRKDTPKDIPPTLADPDYDRNYLATSNDDADVRLEQRIRRTTEIRLVEHNRDRANGQQIGRALQGCETVVFELPDSTAEERATVQTALQHRVDVDPEDHDAALTANVALSGTRLPEHIYDAVDNLPPSVKRVKLFGTATGTSEIADEMREYDDTLNHHASNVTIRGLTANLVRNAASYTQTRTAAIAEQLISLAREEDAFGAHTVGLVSEWPETGTSDQLTQSGFKSTARNITPSLFREIVHQEAVTPDSVTPEQLDRLVTERQYYIQGYPALGAYNMATRLQPEEITTLLNKIGSVKAAGIAGHKPHEAITEEIFEILDTTFIRQARKETRES